MLRSRPLSTFSTQFWLKSPFLSRLQSTNQPSAQNIFDYKSKQLQRKRAAISALNHPKGVHTFDYIKSEVGWRLADRVFDIKRTFTTGVEISAGRGYVSRYLDDDAVDYLVLVDPVKELLKQRKFPEHLSRDHQDLFVAEDHSLPFIRDASVDLIVSCLSLHWINDLHAAFRDYFRALRPDGAFIGAMYCSDTLYELRSALLQAEMELQNSYTARISPFVRPEDVAALLNLAGYNMVTLDSDEFRVGYPSALELMRDLQGMGDQNCAIGRQMNLNDTIIKKTCDLYRDMFSDPSEEFINATFQVIYWIGWRPDPSNEPQVAERGSGTFSLKDLEKLTNQELPLHPVK